MRLSDAACRNAKPQPKLQKLSDGMGLQLWIKPNGSKLWRYAYRYGGKQRSLTLGSYPLVGLADARKGRDDAKRHLLAGRDPMDARREMRKAQTVEALTFKIVADEYVDKLRREEKSRATLAKAEWLLSVANASIGDASLSKITAMDVLEALRQMEARGVYYSAHRLKSVISAVFRYAIATARADNDPTFGLRGALTIPKVVQRPAITDARAFGALMRAIEMYEGQFVTRAALKLLALLFPRPGELRRAEWSEFDLESKIWNIPEARMKGRRPHAVPLPTQAVTIIEELKTVARASRLLFPSVVNARRCISENTLNGALRRLGYDTRSQHCAHGFRSTASTLLNGSGKWSADAIERQLSHIEENEVRRAYDRATHWTERVKMMQWWADYVDQLRDGGKVVQLVAG